MSQGILPDNHPILAPLSLMAQLPKRWTNPSPAMFALSLLLRAVWYLIPAAEDPLNSRSYYFLLKYLKRIDPVQWSGTLPGTLIQKR